ncbi:MAG: nucleotidyl transferase AbiEii/AbiGii toxin family protein [Alphaproteobacteria bacterium]|nr:nucleotidyl transferase AbiEii/AbiGii toxin family protein [Alphaproteobacteria bacterium]
MTEDAFASFLGLPEQDRRDAFAVAARRLDTVPGYVEKDFWVCLVLDALFNRLPGGHPKLLFKGGTSLSKVFGLIRRFSEDIDLVVGRDGLGFAGDRDPTIATGLSNKRRSALFDELAQACGRYVLGDLKAALAEPIGRLTEECALEADPDDAGGQTLLVAYPTLYPGGDAAYVPPRVKIEAGARSAVEPGVIRAVSPYVADDLPDWPFGIGNVATLAPERTFWEKLLILHGLHCGYRDAGRLPADRDRISRHYYDAAMIAATATGESALADTALLDAVRNHNLVAFRQAWKRFEEAVPGSLRLVPQPELLSAVERDYRAMRDMILGDAPAFGWIVDRLQDAEVAANRI